MIARHGTEISAGRYPSAAAGCRASSGGWMRLNSCFSWNSETLPERRPFEKFSTSTSFDELGEAADHPRTVDDQFADGVHHAVEPLERNAHGFGLRQSLRSRPALARAAAAASARCGFALLAASAASAGASTRFLGRQFRDPRQQRVHGGGISASLDHWRCRNFFRTSTDSRHMSTISALGFKTPSRNWPNKILDAMGNGGEPVQVRLARLSLSPCAWSGKGD